MKGIFSKIILLFFICTAVFAQKDLIVTQSSENIRCKIIHESHDSFTYIYLGPDKKLVESSIFKSLVSTFKYNYYPDDLIHIKSENDNAKPKRNRFTNKNEENRQTVLRDEVSNPLNDKTSQLANSKKKKWNIMFGNSRSTSKSVYRIISPLNQIMALNDSTKLDSLKKNRIKELFEI